MTEAECGDCYAKRWADRHRLDVLGSLLGSDRHLTKTQRDPRKWNQEAEVEGRRFRVFCASLADVFKPHPQVAQARTNLWTLIEETPHLDWQLLTKRPKFIRRHRSAALVAALARTCLDRQLGWYKGGSREAYAVPS